MYHVIKIDSKNIFECVIPAVLYTDENGESYEEWTIIENNGKSTKFIIRRWDEAMRLQSKVESGEDFELLISSENLVYEV